MRRVFKATARTDVEQRHRFAPQDDHGEIDRIGEHVKFVAEAEGCVDGFAELTLVAADPRRLAGFYEAVFGMARLSEQDDRIWLATGAAARLGIWSPGAKDHDDRGGHHVHFAFSVSSDSLQEIVLRARNLGLDVEGPIEHEGGDRSIYLTDPAGNRVEAWNYYAKEHGGRRES